MPSLRDSCRSPRYPGASAPGFHVALLRGWNSCDSWPSGEIRVFGESEALPLEYWLLRFPCGFGGKARHTAPGVSKVTFDGTWGTFMLNPDYMRRAGAGGYVSPLVQRSRQSPKPAGGSEHWSMLVFESMSVGAMMVLIVIMAMMIAVGFYTIFVWPLTLWELAEVGGDAYASWIKTVLWSVFAGGTLAGYWCVSGAAFSGKPKGASGRKTASSVPRALR